MTSDFVVTVRGEDQIKASYLEKIAKEAAQNRGGTHAELADSERLWQFGHWLTRWRFAVIS